MPKTVSIYFWTFLLVQIYKNPFPLSISSSCVLIPRSQNKYYLRFFLMMIIAAMAMERMNNKTTVTTMVVIVLSLPVLLLWVTLIFPEKMKCRKGK